MSRLNFNMLAKGCSRLAGRPATFVVSATVILTWLVTGPLFGFSDSIG